VGDKAARVFETGRKREDGKRGGKRRKKTVTALCHCLSSGS